MVSQGSIKIWFRITFINLIILSILSFIAIYWSASAASLHNQGLELMTFGGRSNDFATAGEIFTGIETLNDYRNKILYVYLVCLGGLYLSFIIWFYRFQDYLRSKEVSLDYTNEWAGLVWFIPLVNLVYGSKLLQDIWTKLSPNEEEINWAEFLIYVLAACFVMPGVKILSYRTALYTDFDYGATQASYSVMAYGINLVAMALIAVILLKINRFLQEYLKTQPESNLMDHFTDND